MAKQLKEQKRELTNKQRAVAKILVEKRGISLGAAMKEGGYSDASAKNPVNFTRSKGYRRILKKAGVTEEMLSEGHYELIRSAKIEHLVFTAENVARRVTKDKSGKTLKKPYTEHSYRHVPDEEIKRQIESVPGYKFMYILKGTSSKTVYFQAPENAVRTKNIEMAYDVLDLKAPDRLDITEYELSPSERETLKKIYG